MSTPAPLQRPGSANACELPPMLAPTPANAPAWKDELNARLREHRQRRGEAGRADAAGVALPERRNSVRGSSAVAERVAERYRQAPSYQELLASSARAAAAAAESAAEAALEAHAAAQAVLSHWEMPAEHSPEAKNAHDDVFADPFFTAGRVGIEHEPEHPQSLFRDTSEAAGWSVAARQDAAAAQPEQQVLTHAPLPARAALPVRTQVSERARTLAGLVDAFAEAVVPAAQALPAKLIEFPRELIAPRKQRPRLAEGPLFEQASPSVSLRIFEVGAEAPDDAGSMGGGEPVEGAQIAKPGEDAMERRTETEREEPVPRRRGSFQQAPQGDLETGWGSIRLGEHPQAAIPEPASARRPEHGYSAQLEPALNDLAPIGDRAMAALVDGGLVFGCFLLSVLVFASCTVHPPAGRAALAAGAVIFGALATFYGWLFMSYGGGSTPGMRYARIALCTFADENPRRKDLQNRIPATALALLPLGLGVFWALLDEDKLGWHDRMTRTYQRSYR